MAGYIKEKKNKNRKAQNLGDTLAQFTIYTMCGGSTCLCNDVDIMRMDEVILAVEAVHL